MTTLHRYFARLFILRFLLVLIGVSLAVVAFEMTEAFSGDEWTSETVFRYTLLRLPSLMAQLLPIATLIAALLTVAELLRQRELVATWGSGLSQFRLLTGLLPVLLSLGLLQFLLNDQVVPHTTDALRDWGVGEFRSGGLLSGDREFIWLRSGNDIVRIAAQNLQEEQLEQVTLFRRSEDGTLLDRLDAAVAVKREDGWLLRDVVRHDTDPYRTTEVPELAWKGHVEVAQLRLVERPPRELALVDLWDLLQSDGYGQRPRELYATWVNARLAQFFGAPLVLCLAFALGQGWRRTGEVTRLTLSGLAFGFAFFILDGMSVALGEVGFLPPLLAAWSPPILLACLVAHLLLKPEATAPITLSRRS
ncbi:LptF/LptG family permease [Aquibaculum arenosum]|uniref:LptF/LptG family permease n=1 Tax=Aquibaculum arenosum TaxID=3032591 RepID=A0ABT5YIK7_9PROT|nr:LptF/LptG family permease [Fodinicurvata sp. CAU 1616]MDF2094645.1 LptF/LptG family permease [Fodinicurvata sp. CAU 1616]